ncbi:hypothetical protein D3C81_1837190 [compost metagenome]
MIEGVLDQRRRFVDVEFAPDAQAVCLHRAHADVQVPGHFLVVQALRHLRQDLAFPRGQFVVGVPVGDQALGDFGAVEGSAAGDGFDGGDDFP